MAMEQTHPGTRGGIMKPYVEYQGGRFKESAAYGNRQFNRLATKRIHAKDVNCHNSTTPATLTAKTGKPARIKVLKYRKPTLIRPKQKDPAWGRNKRKELQHIQTAVQGLERFE